MNKYELEFIMKDGSRMYDFTSMTNDCIEQVKNKYKNMIEKGHTEKLRNCLEVKVSVMM